MTDYSIQNKRAWEYNAYEFWVKQSGTPSERAKRDMENPIGMLKRYSDYFDVVFMEGGILHYFHDIDVFMHIMYALLNDSGKMICSDFHPFTKMSDILDLEQITMDYFSTDVFEGEMAHARFFEDDIRREMPKCSYRKYTISEIINSVINSGFVIRKFDEHPAWTNSRIPGEFTIIADK